MCGGKAVRSLQRFETMDDGLGRAAQLHEHVADVEADRVLARAEVPVLVPAIVDEGGGLEVGVVMLPCPAGIAGAEGVPAGVNVLLDHNHVEGRRRG